MITVGIVILVIAIATVAYSSWPSRAPANACLLIRPRNPICPTPHFPGIPLPPLFVLILTGPSVEEVIESGEASRGSGTEGSKREVASKG